MYISQCLIVKNEEKNIRYCLEHLKSVVDEQIVVDTGSTDRTVEIAKELGAKIFYFDWINDFSAARNFALDKAKGDWIIFLDCDEYFSEVSIDYIISSVKQADLTKDVNGIISEMINLDDERKVLSTVKNISPRIFKKKSHIRFRNKIHEVLTDEKRKEHKYSVLCIDESERLKIYHTGYSKNSMEEKDKNKRNIDLLIGEFQKNPEDSQLSAYISKQYYVNNEYEKALEYGNIALDNMDKILEHEYYPNIFSSIMMAMVSLEKSSDEVKYVFDQAVERYPDYPDYYRLMGISSYNNRHIKEAIEYFEKCIYYCINYSNVIESLALGQIDQVYSELLNAYILEDNKKKIVEIAVALLDFDRYNLEILTVLLKVFLTQENEDNIINFFNKKYDKNNFKDKIYLIKASEIAKSEKIYDYYIKLLNGDELNELNKNKL